MSCHSFHNFHKFKIHNFIAHHYCGVSFSSLDPALKGISCTSTTHSESQTCGDQLLSADRGDLRGLCFSVSAAHKNRTFGLWCLRPEFLLTAGTWRERRSCSQSLLMMLEGQGRNWEAERLSVLGERLCGRANELESSASDRCFPGLCVK